MTTTMNQELPQDKSAWRQIVARYQTASLNRSVIQLITSVVPYFVLLVLMYFSLDISYWLTLLLAIPAAGFVIRIFIIFHDCGHGSFFASREANEWVGRFTGVLTFTPYHRWRRAHAIHHATAGDLDRREAGDVWTMTVDEYLESPPLKRLGYRVYRFPPIMLTVGAWMSFLVFERLWFWEKDKRARNSVIWTDVALLAIAVVATLTIGLKAYLLIQIPVICLAASAGVWLFYVQHQFEGVYWQRHEDWDYVDAALQGSSYYKLPSLLQWFSGNIGFHHIHHLSPKIPNYNLEQANNENSLFQIAPVTPRSSLKSLGFRLWDEENHQLVGFSEAKRAAELRSAPAKPNP
ncbi:MAG: fatty acid desaturase [Chloroflexota bacterium]|nr:fatty acid desaturase [Chloroflexota bacterium]